MSSSNRVHCAFRGTDRDNDGHIEPGELKTVMANVGMVLTDEQARALIAGVDTDGNGMVRGPPQCESLCGRVARV